MVAIPKNYDAVTEYYFNRVKEFFDGDLRKTILWWSTPNPLMGHKKPMDSLVFDNTRDNLFKFIDERLEE